MEDIAAKALLQQNIAFVQLFVQNGLIMEEFLTVGRTIGEDYFEFKKSTLHDVAALLESYSAMH